MGRAIERAEPLGYQDVADAIARLKIAVARRANDETEIGRIVRTVESATAKKASRRKHNLRRIKQRQVHLRLVPPQE